VNDGIGDDGAIGIANGLEKNTSLKELLLGSVFPAHLFLHSLLIILSNLSLVFCDVKDELCISHFCD
jgi:hypothetical protein